MPTYEYQCTACGYEFEKFQKITEDPIVNCPQCSGFVERLIPKGGGFILKGHGFHATDYGRGNTVTRCGKESPCCGREIPCDTKPCDK